MCVFVCTHSKKKALQLSGVVRFVYSGSNALVVVPMLPDNVLWLLCNAFFIRLVFIAIGAFELSFGHVCYVFCAVTDPLRVG